MKRSTMKNHYQRSLYIILLLSLVQSPLRANTDKYRLTLRDNPSVSIVIGWNQVSGVDPVVHYDTVDHGDQWKKYTFKATPDRETVYAEMANKFVRLNELIPNTAYYFIIRDSEGL